MNSLRLLLLGTLVFSAPLALSAPTAPRSLRQARMVVTVSKYTFTQAEGGSYTSEDVCNVETTIDVWDVRGQPGRFVPDEDAHYKVSCDSVLTGEPVTVLVGGEMLLYTDTAQMGGDRDRKWINLDLWIDPDSTAHKKLSPLISFGVDLNNVNIEAILQPLVDMQCTPPQTQDGNWQCTTDTPELFAATVRIIDQP